MRLNSNGLKVQYLPVSSLKPNDKNPRAHDEAQIGQIAASIKEFGFNNPILTCKGRVVAGQGRLDAAKSMGMVRVPTIELRHLSPQQRRAYVIADNQIALNSSWDSQILPFQIAELKDAGFDMASLGFNDRELQTYVAEAQGIKEGLTDDDHVPEKPKKAVTKVGDVWKLGAHSLACFDSFDFKRMAGVASPKNVGMIISDPPYGINLDTDFSWREKYPSSTFNCAGGNRVYPKMTGDDKPFSSELLISQYSSCKEQFWFGANYYCKTIPKLEEGSWLVWDKRKETQDDFSGSAFELVWSRVKHNQRILRHDWFGFLSSQNAQDARNRVHPAQKPVSLLVEIIEYWGGKVRTILDPFLGAGSTMIAAEKTNRACIGIEIEPTYCDVTIDRWQQFTGGKAKRERA